MNTHRVRVDPDHDTDGDFAVLACPLCNGNYIHVDNVHVGGRPQEDGDFVYVAVDSSGNVRQNLGVGEVAVPETGNMRRHWITLVADCELCGARFAYAFVQHKGQTLLQVIQQGWRIIESD